MAIALLQSRGHRCPCDAIMVIAIVLLRLCGHCGPCEAIVVIAIALLRLRGHCCPCEVIVVITIALRRTSTLTSWHAATGPSWPLHGHRGDCDCSPTQRGHCGNCGNCPAIWATTWQAGLSISRNT